MKKMWKKCRLKRKIHSNPEMDYCENNSGITLIALVVTIIVMLILVGVTLSQIVTNNGIIGRTENAREIYQEQAEKEKIELACSELLMVSKAEGKEITAEDIKNKIESNGENVKIIVDEDYPDKMKVIFGDTNNIFEIDIETGKTDYIGQYNTKDENIELQQEDIEIKTIPYDLTNENVKTKITVNDSVDMTDYTLQYSTDGKEWINYTAEVESTKNETIYARVKYELAGICKVTASKTITNIDKLEPEGTVEVVTTTNSATLSVTANDAEKTADYACSGIKGYYYSNDDGATYTEITTDTSYTFSGLIQSKEYNFKVKVEDNVGNILEISKNDTTKTVEPATDKVTFGNVVWSSGKATLDITTLLENYQIQYQVDSIAEDGWTVGTTVSGVSHGSVVYARLFDGVNGGSEASFTVSDTQAPTTATISSSNIGSTSFTLTATGADSQSGVAKYEFYVGGSLYDTVITKEATATCNVTGRTTGTTYSCYVIVKDEADLTKQSSSVSVLCNLSPVVSSVSTGTRTSSSIQVSAKATDADGNNLVYKLYVGGTLKATSASTAQNTTVTLTASGLNNYTSYSYYVTVTDGFVTATSSTYTAKTKCSGTTSYCSGGSSGTSCSGQTTYCSGGYTTYKCCGDGYCTSCGHSYHSGGNCGTYIQSGQFGYYCSCSHSSNSCPGSTTTHNCSHGYYSSHYYCSHGYTSSHTYGAYTCSHSKYSSHYYCSHNSNGTSHD